MEPLPAFGVAPASGAVVAARFRMTLASDLWVHDVSTSFPDATLRLLTGVPRGDRALELGEVRGANAPTVTDAIRTHADVFAYDELYADPERVIGQYEADERSLYEFLWESSLPPEFPIVVEDGAMTFDVTATRPQFEAFGDALDATGRRYELLSVVHANPDESFLTDRQRECLAAAHRRGYFDVPKRCTLADVAAALDVDKSTASETIRRATDRVVGRFLTTDD